MLSILLHSSKTMRQRSASDKIYQAPQLLGSAEKLAGYMKSLSTEQIADSMKVSVPMAVKTHDLMAHWTTAPNQQLPAIDAFLGDIYSGLQTQTFSKADRTFANDHLLILSGLYGVLRALDSIMPYRLEMGYRLPDAPYGNLYSFWGDTIAKHMPNSSTLINLSAVEYTKAVLPYLPNSKVISPRFLTFDQKTKEPKFVVVHAKIARGAFARWLIQHRIDAIQDLEEFNDLGYQFNANLSTAEVPVFVCNEFKGLGLSVRLTY